MLDHVGVRVSDLQTSKTFYTEALRPLGYAPTADMPEWKVVGFGAGGKSDFWINEEPVIQKGHVAFAAGSKKMVDDFHKAGLGAGGTDNGAPGYRTDYSPGYYAAFLKDPDGHNIEVVFHDPSAAA